MANVNPIILTGGDGTVENSDISFQQIVPAGDTVVLEDYEFEFQDENGVPYFTQFVPAMIAQTLTIYGQTVFTFDVYVNGVFQSTQLIDVTDNLNINIG